MDLKVISLILGLVPAVLQLPLLSYLPGSFVTGTDISDQALMIAAENAMLNNVKVTFIKDDILNPDTSQFGKAGIIVSNPPYIRDSEKQLMKKNVLEFEPHNALFVSDSDPLVYYNGILIRQIIFWILWVKSILK